MKNRIQKIIRVAAYLTNVQNPLDVFNTLKNAEVVVFDVESTGLDQHKNQITQIAAVRLSGFEIVDTFHEKIALSEKTQEQIKKEALEEQDPEDKSWNTTKALKHTGYHEISMPANDEMQVLKEFKAFCEKKPAYLVAHNAKFDMKMIGTRVGKINSLGVHDTMIFARFFFLPMLKILSEEGNEHAQDMQEKTKNFRGKPSSGLNNLAKAFGMDTSKAHTALADVTNTAKLMKKIVDFIFEHANIMESPGFEQQRQKAVMKEQFFKKLDREKKLEKRKEYRTERRRLKN